MKKLLRFTIGLGDCFAHQGEAQLSGVQSAAERGVPLHPVCNKSNRERTLIGTSPEGLRAEADADHINLHTVDGFIAVSDSFTHDVAESGGERMKIAKDIYAAALPQAEELMEPLLC